MTLVRGEEGGAEFQILRSALCREHQMVWHFAESGGATIVDARRRRVLPNLSGQGQAFLLRQIQKVRPVCARREMVSAHGSESEARVESNRFLKHTRRFEHDSFES